MNNQEPTRGRPPLPEGAAATSQIQLRVHTQRKAAYVRTASAQGKTLAEWCFEHLDAASGYKTDAQKVNDQIHEILGLATKAMTKEQQRYIQQTKCCPLPECQPSPMKHEVDHTYYCPKCLSLWNVGPTLTPAHLDIPVTVKPLQQT